MQNAYHEGYEYQDYFAVAIILQLMLKRVDADIIIDRKGFKGDKFDDLKVKTQEETTEYQIKYSDDINLHRFTKDDFSNGNGHDTALSDLFLSWKTSNVKKNDNKIKLCLSWDRPTDDDKIIEFLKPIQDYSLPFYAMAYNFDGELFWPEGKTPPKTWRKFNTEIKKGHICRESFISFCNELTILLEMPKASLDLSNPGGLEKELIKQVEKLGIGIYPNDKLSIEDIIYKLAAEVKHSRAIGNKLNSSELVKRLGLIMDYGKFDQRFPIDSSHQIMLNSEIDKLHKSIQESNRIILTGNPGSGKSWFVEEYIDKLKGDNKKVLKYNCFQALQDINSLDRIRINSLYGNLIAQIMEQIPELIKYKKTVWGADKEELENLLKTIKEDIYLVVDGIDHISREYELNKDIISQSETEIISELLKIQFPSNCYVLIASQPVAALAGFKDQKYKIFEIKSWGIEEVKSLMKTYQIDDNRIEEDEYTNISDYLLMKSQGNALYLSYILRQLRTKEISKILIDEIPDYNVNLSDYYTYLYTKVYNNQTINALCGATFYLSTEDLIEITGNGDYVEGDLEKLQPLLIENRGSGGFSIYHESFRRFVLTNLKDKRVDLNRNVYGIIADWLCKKEFFTFEKSYYFLPELLYKMGRDDDNIALVDKEFVLQSISEGYSREQIKKNLDYIIRSAGRKKDLLGMVMAGELLAMLCDLNDFESTGEEYFQAICDVKGATKLNQLMQFEGKPTFDKKIGKLACYVSSKSGITPWWELYLDIHTPNIEVSDMKYYLRYYLDNQGSQNITNLMEVIEKEDINLRNQCLEIAYNELKDYIQYDEIVSIAEKQHLSHWIDYLLYIKTGYYSRKDVTVEDVINKWNIIKQIEMPEEKDNSIFRDFFSNIYYLCKQGDRVVIDRVISECRNINWFYNWIIFSVNNADLCARSEHMDSRALCKEVITNLRLLLQDTEVFKGKPRVCDLYFIQNELIRSYEQAIKLVIKNGGAEDLEKVLEILYQLDDETGIMLDNINGGPLTDIEFLKLMDRFLTAENYETIKPYLEKIQRKIEINEVYDYIAIAKLRIASIISKYSQIEALGYYDSGIRYLVGYGYHKDIILEQILDSYQIYFKSVTNNPEEERDIITKMTIALWNHTDRRETKHFLNKWFDILLDIEPEFALSFLAGFQIKNGKSWIVDRMVRSVISKYSNNAEYVSIVISLIESLPNDSSPQIINAASLVFNTLSKLSVDIDCKDKQLVKHRMSEIATNIVSRFNVLDDSWPERDFWKDESIKHFLLSVEASGYDITQYKKFFHIDSENKKNEAMINVITDSHISHEYNTLEDVKEWLENHEIMESDISDICKFLKNYSNDNETLFEIIKNLFFKSSIKYFSKKQKDLVYRFIKNIELDDAELAEIHMMLYLYSYEWDSVFVDIDEFCSSIELDYKVAFETFYREAPERIISNSGRITKGILEALFSIGFDKNNIAAIWRSSFDIMKLRFPSIDQNSTEYTLEKKEERLGLRESMLMRFIDGGKEQFLAVYSYLANAAEEKNYEEFSESISVCLEYFDNYNLVTQIAIAELIRCYGHQLTGINRERVIKAVDNIYPTGNMLLDVLFSKFTIYKSYLLTCIEKHEPDYMEQEDIEFYLGEKLYDLGKEEKNENIKEYARNSIYRDSIMKVVNDCGIDYEELYIKLYSSKKLRNQLKDFVDGVIGIPEKNTIYKSYGIQYAQHAILEKAYFDKNPKLISHNLHRLIPDYQGMYRLFKCREIPPSAHLYDKESKYEPFLYNSEDNYIQIGCFEEKLSFDYYKRSIVHAYQGICGMGTEAKKCPFRKYHSDSIIMSEKNTISYESGEYIGLSVKNDMELEGENYLFPEKSIIELYDVHFDFDYLHRRYIGVNSQGDIIFILKNWLSCYKGDSEYSGNAIPLNSGTQLYIRKEYISELEKNYGSVMMKTYVDHFFPDSKKES